MNPHNAQPVLASGSSYALRFKGSALGLLLVCATLFAG
jgi:hypothetical protein